MSLRNKILLTLFALIVSYVALTYSIQRTLIYPSFDELQNDLAAANLARIEGAIDAIIGTTNRMCTDTAHWDPSYAYMLGENPEYATDNFNRYFYIEADFNFVMIFDREGNVVWSDAFDIENETSLSIDQILLGPIKPEDPIAARGAENANVYGLMATRLGPAVVVSSSILKTTGDGPSLGALLLGKVLDDTTLRGISRRVDVEFELFEISGGLSGTYFPGLQSTTTGVDPVEHVTQGDELVSSKILKDVYGNPTFMLRGNTPRSITAVGLSAVQLAMILIVVAGLLVLAVNWILLQHLILKPVSSLTRHISKLRASGDLSDRLELERSDELGTLAGQFNALTGELKSARDEMVTTRDQAVELARIKSEFLATMSHEIRTPMNGVVGMAELLTRTPLSEKQKRFASTIQSSANSLLGIINDILDLSKLESGRLELECRDFGIRSVVEEIVNMFAGPAHAKGLELVCAIPPELDAICKGDPNRLRQVLTNLVGNAIKFTKRGEVILEVAVEEENENEYGIRFSVRDSGIGIPEDQQALVFDAFSQADASTTRQFGGTGLGLTICRRLVELMGGEIGVDSKPGFGSTFWLTLQLERSGMASSVWKLAPTSLGGIRVLIAHDNPTSRRLLEDQLAAWGMWYASTASGSEALEMLQTAAGGEEAFELFIADADMPDLQGAELMRKIRADRKNANIPVVMLCSVTSENDLEEPNIRACLTKPVLQSALFDCLSTLLGHTGTLRTDEPDPSAATGGALGIRVLLAEDNAVNRDVAMAMLDDIGCRYDAVRNGEEALAALASRHYDLVLMDCQMPVMDGYRATQEIRRRESLQGSDLHIPVIALTANAIKGDRDTCLAAGMDDYLSKPFKLNDLRELIALWSDANRPSTSGESSLENITPDDEAVDLINSEALDEIRSLQSPRRPTLLADLIRSFFESSEGLIEDLRNAVEADDATAVSETAHALKSSSGNVGARAVSKLASELEALGKTGDLSHSKSILNRLEELYASTQQALEREIG